MNENEFNFDEMRSQIAILKEKLASESIINEKMMRTVLNTKVNSLRYRKWIEYACALFVMIMCPIAFRGLLGCSWEFIAFTDLLMLFCIYMSKKIYGPVTKRDLMSGNLLEVSQKMSKFKKQLKNWLLYVSGPLCLVWVALMMWELDNSPIKTGHEQYIHSMMAGVIVGLVIGMCIGIYMTLTAVNTASEIIRQIEE